MEGFPCRTCLSIIDEGESVNIEQKCHSNKTAKEILIQFLPQMECTLSDSDRICRICFKTIKCFMRFLDKCLDIEKNFPRHGFTGKSVQSLDVDGNIEIVENIQIVVEDDLQEYYEETDVVDNAEDSTENVEHDHAYIKSEGEDGEVSPDQFVDYEPGDITQETIAETEEVSNEDCDYENSDEQDNLIYSQSESPLITMEGMESQDKINVKRENMETGDSIILAAEDVAFYEPLETENIYICELCGEGFLSELLLKDHFAVHGEVSIICDKCPKIFKNNTALRAHYKLKHTDAERYKCNVCDQTFARADYLRNHVKRHEEDEDNNSSKVKSRVPGKFLRFRNTDEPLPCKLCGKYYNGIQKLKVHLQTHLIVKRYKCEYCDLTYKRWPSLKRHEKSHLESNKIFHRCNVCWKRFNTEPELEAHMTQHGNPRYRCQICEEYFHRKYLFDNHYLLKHATEEDIENSKKEIIYNTLLELSNQDVLVE